MTPFEQELQNALARQQPSSGFTERVLAQLPASRPPMRKTVAWRLAVAAAAAIFIAGGSAYREYERHLQGETAKRQLLLAVRITGIKLQQVQQRLQQSEVNQ